MSANKEFEKLISNAFAEYADEEFGSITETESYPIPAKELKWARAQDKQRRYKKPMWQVHLQRCAAVLLILCSVCAVVLTTNVEVRAFVTETFSEWFNSFISIFYTAEAPSENADADIYLYDVTYIPDGFTVTEKKETESARLYTYESGEKHIAIEIAYTENATVSANKNMNSYEEIWLGSHSAYVLYDENNGNGAVIFGDESITVAVEGNLSRQELIEIAKGINMNEANILGFVREFSGHKAELPNTGKFEYGSYISGFSYLNETKLEKKLVIGFKLPELWVNDSIYDVVAFPNDLSYPHRTMGTPPAYYKVDKGIEMDKDFLSNAHIIMSQYEYVGRKFSPYRTANGFDCAIYYLNDGFGSFNVCAFVKIDATSVLEITIYCDGNDPALALDIIDSLKIGAYDDTEKAEITPYRPSYDGLITDSAKKYYMMLEKGEITEDMIFSGSDAKDMRLAVLAYRNDTAYESWRSDYVIYQAYVPNYAKDEIVVKAFPAKDEYEHLNASEDLYDFELDILTKRINELDGEYAKVKYIANWLSSSVTYREWNEGFGANSHTSICAISNGYAECPGIAYAFEAICRRTGINVRTVGSETEEHPEKDGNHTHYWNIVNIGTNWYHIDISRMIEDYDNRDDYFLVSENEIEKYNGECYYVPFGKAEEHSVFWLPPCQHNYFEQLINE